MFLQITYFQIFGKPLIMWGGLLTLIFLLLTIIMVVAKKNGVRKFPVKWHSGMAIITLILALAHGTLGILAYF